MTLSSYICIAVLLCLSYVCAHTAQEANDLVSYLQEFSYLENTLNTPADKVFFDQELTESDLDILDIADQQSLSMNTLSSEFASSSLLDLDIDASEGDASLDVCPPLVTEFCRPCYKFHSDLTKGPCGKWRSVCEKMFCEPLCRRELWSVKVAVAEGADPEFKQQVESPDVLLGLESYFLQYGCGDMLGCCTPTPGNNYLERHAYAGEFPRLGTVRKCRGMSSREKANALCEGQIQVAVVPVEGACAKFTQPNSTKIFDKAYERTGIEAASSYHGAMRARCDALQKKIGENAEKLQKKFQEMVCPCIGCGDHNKCPLSLSFGVLPVAYAEFPGSDLGDYILQPTLQ